MSAPRLQSDAAVVARIDTAHAIESNACGFALMRLVVAAMQREADADRTDNGDVESWAGMLRWLVTTLDDGNDELRDRCLEAGWLQQP